MRRPRLLTVLGGAAMGPLVARAQQRPLPLVALLRPTTDETHVGAFRRALHELGYVEGQNVSLQTRSADGDNRQLPKLAAELAALKPAVIVTNGAQAIPRCKRKRRRNPV